MTLVRIKILIWGIGVGIVGAKLWGLGVGLGKSNSGVSG